MSDFLITNKGYFIQIVRKSDGRIERIRKRISTGTICKECFKKIEKGKVYIRDEFKYPFGRKYFVSFICLECWRGQIPVLLSTNRNIKK